LVNFKIKILGEVNRPSTYNFTQYRVNIFDVLAAAGDITYFGNKKSVKIIRKANNKDVIYNLDVRNADILQNPNYYLQSGDIVYVEPNKGTKAFNNFNIPMSTIAGSLSIISTGISLILTILLLRDRN
jgi:polysaccharide export outer membrane protein